MDNETTQIVLNVPTAELRVLAEQAERAYSSYSHGAEDDDERLFCDLVLDQLLGALSKAVRTV